MAHTPARIPASGGSIEPSGATSRTSSTGQIDGSAPQRAGRDAAVRRDSEGADQSAQLDALARAYGIEPEFIDALDVLQRAADGTKRALLAAMGVRAGSAAEVEASLGARAAEAWQSGLPPVTVTALPAALTVVVPRGLESLTWRVALEDGGAVTGSSAVGSMPLLESAERDGRVFERRTLTLDPLPLGYHRVRVDGFGDPAGLIVTPAACWVPPAVDAGERLAGIAIQLYLLRSRSNWGIGDFGDLRAFVDLVAARGADVVGLNPLHAMFPDNPEHASPYSPASRILLNVLNIDVAAVPEFAHSSAARRRLAEPAVAAALQACRDAEWVDYSAVAALKLDVLGLLYATFLDAAEPARRAAFTDFCAAATPARKRTYTFLALRERFAAGGLEQAAWQRWPADYHDPASPAVVRFEAEHADRVTFAAWLHWIADTQLGAAAGAARHMRVGLYRDLAVGADPAGAETWTNARAVVTGARIGAPPDIYNPQGQNWDLPPFAPHALRAEGYASFIELVRVNMRHAGGLRIDHVMALQHAYWIPQGAAPADGAYVGYPLEDLVGILALESHRARCFVVGEDLGTVPAGFRERMQRANILSYRVLFFERGDDGAFEPPDAYPRGALAVLGSHDLPTLAAWWSDADINLRERIGLFDAAASDGARRMRAADRAAFVTALQTAGLLGAGDAPDADGLFTAAHEFLARSAAALAVAQIDDITAETEPVNVPTTSGERPNWRRRLSRTLDELAADPRFAETFAIFARARRTRSSIE